jgi:pilus assembly protein CpaF
MTSLLPFLSPDHPGSFVPARDGGERGGGGVRGSAGGRSVAAAEFGPLAALVDDPRVTDVFVNGRAGLFVDRGDGARPDPSWAPGPDELRRLAVRLVARGGRHVDEAHPCADVRLADGIRVHVVLEPVSISGTVLSIRLPAREPLDLDALQAGGTMTPAQRVILDEAVVRRRNVLVSGAGGSGKTTLLAALLASAPPDERIVTIEDVAELRIRHPHHISLQSRQANLEGAGEIGLTRLVREALRMRPDRLVLGECRGAELRELLSALNTGHDGGAGTVHANSLHDVPTRLEALGALAGLDEHAVARQTVSAVHLVIHLERSGGARRIAAIGRPVLDDAGVLRMRASGAGDAQ